MREVKPSDTFSPLTTSPPPVSSLTDGEQLPPPPNLGANQLMSNWKEMREAHGHDKLPEAPVQLHAANAGVKQCDHNYPRLYSNGVGTGLTCSNCNDVLASTSAAKKCAHGYSFGEDGLTDCAPCSMTTLTQGKKNDAGKPDLSLVSSELMVALAEVRAFGATKYPKNNWKLGFKYTRSIAAALRHIMAFKDGEDLDPESGLTHIAHAIASLEHLLHDYKHRRGENDDRK